MLSEEEIEHSADETLEAAASFELDLLVAIASSMMAVKNLTPRSINREALKLQRNINTITARHSVPIKRAIQRDLLGHVLLSSLRDNERLHGIKGAATSLKEIVERATAKASDAVAAVMGDTRRMQKNMGKYARVAYRQEMQKLTHSAQVLGYEKALSQSIASMAQKGITANVYQRRGKNGELIDVHVPVDVGFRSVIERAGLQRSSAEAIDLARRTTGLVAVSITAGARASHDVWQGKVYTIDNMNPGYPSFEQCCHYDTRNMQPTDMVEGFDGYNCRHALTTFIEGETFPWDDPLKGTGYTQEEARNATTKQRHFENEMRKAKREREVLKRSGFGTKSVDLRIRNLNQRLKAHTAQHAAILKRKPWRESIFEKAQREVVFNEAYRWNKKTLVDLKMLKTKEFDNRAREAFGGKLSDSQLRSIKAMLRHRSGTVLEDLYAFDLTTGRVLSSVVRAKTPREVHASPKMKRSVKGYKRKGHEVVMAHNHPGSSPPSWGDIVSMDASGIDFGIIACHDGSFYTYRRTKPAEIWYNDEEAYKSVTDRFSARGEAKLFDAIEERFGVRIEHCV